MTKARIAKTPAPEMINTISKITSQFLKSDAYRYAVNSNSQAFNGALHHLPL